MRAAFLLLALVLSGCGIIEGRAPSIDAKGFGGDPRAKKTAENAVAWVLRELRAASGRNFSLAPEAMDYRGQNATMKSDVQALQQNATRFFATQELLASVMGDVRFAALLGRVTVAIATPEEIAALANAHDDAAVRGEQLVFSRRRIEELEKDPRALVVYVAHHALHAFGFGRDGQPASGPLPMPSALASAENGAVVGGLALQLVLLSNDYRFPIAGDDPESSQLGWNKSFEDDFGGPGGVTAPSANVSATYWAGTTQRQVNGFLNNAIPAVPQDSFSVSTLVNRRDVRVALDLLAGPYETATRVFRIQSRGSLLASLSGGNLQIAGQNYFGTNMCQSQVVATPRFDVVVSFFGEEFVARVNGVVVCQFRNNVASLTRPVTLEGGGFVVDRVRVDINTLE